MTEPIQADSTAGAGGRRLRRRTTLIVGGAVAIALLAGSMALACTVGVHGELVLAPGVGQAGDQIELFSTDNEEGYPPQETKSDGSQKEYPVVMDPTAVSGGTSGSPSQCFEKDGLTGSDDDDVTVGSIAYGSEEVFDQAGANDPANNPQIPEDADAYVYGHGTATIPNWNPGTYELCAKPEINNNWDHFRIIQ